MGIPLESIEGQQQLDARLLCSKCCLVLEMPCSTTCGHHCCSKCMEDVESKDKKTSKLCRKCHAPLARSDKNILPKEMLAELNELSVKCTLGCQTVVKMSFLQKHLSSECQLRIIKCVNRGCNYECSVQSLDEHYKKCLYTFVQCTICGATVTKRDMPAHQAVKKCFEQQIKRERVSSARKVSTDLKNHRTVMLHQRHLSDQQERQLLKQHYGQQLPRPFSASQSIQSRIGSALTQYTRSLSLSNSTSCGTCENKFLSGRRPSARRHSHSKVCAI